MYRILTAVSMRVILDRTEQREHVMRTVPSSRWPAE
jgi:hypothetical protein